MTYEEQITALLEKKKHALEAIAEESAALLESETKNPGDGYVFITRAEYLQDKNAESRHVSWVSGGVKAWGKWGRYLYTEVSEHYQYRRAVDEKDRRIAELEAELAAAKAQASQRKTEPKWLPCTAAEAEANPGASEWLNVDEWTSCAEEQCAFDPRFAYRTMAALPPQIDMPYEQWKALVGPLPPLHTFGGRSWIKRAEVRLGVILG